MIISAKAIFMVEGRLPPEARQRLEVLGKQVRLINTNLWEFECEFRTPDAFQGEFQGNEDFTTIQSSFTLADASTMALRAVTGTFAEFGLHGEVRVISATSEHPIIIVSHTKKGA